MIRAIVADDHTLFRIGLKQLLESFGDIAVVAEAANADEALHRLATVDCTLLVCDLTMPGVTGTSLIEAVRTAHAGLPILVLSMHDEPATVRRALAAGATGYLTKESSPDVLHAAVQAVARSERYLPPTLAQALAFETAAATRAAHEALSQRELQVFRLIAAGSSLAAIAEQLGLSPKTITTHKTHLMEKLGVANNADLIRYAVEHRLFE